MKRIIYVKHSNERAAEFSVRTVIAEDAGIRMVEKYPETAIAGEHAGVNLSVEPKAGKAV